MKGPKTKQQQYMQKFSQVQVERSSHAKLKEFSHFTKIPLVNLFTALLEYVGLLPEETPSNIFEKMADPHFKAKFKVFCELEKEKENKE